MNYLFSTEIKGGEGEDDEILNVDESFWYRLLYNAFQRVVQPAQKTTLTEMINSPDELPGGKALVCVTAEINT